jgi:hypothetical protein
LTDVSEATDVGVIAHRRIAAAGAAAIVLVVVLVLLLGGSGPAPAANGAAAVVPADALAYVNVSLDRGRPAVKQAVALAARLPDFPLAYAAVETRLGGILSGGRSVDFSSQIAPWLGHEAALALLDTATTTAGSLIVLDVSDRARAQAFIRSEGATAHGSYRGTALFTYRTGSELALVSHFLVLGQDASVRAAVDVAAGAAPSLRSSAAYRRASAGEPSNRVLDAYASLAGVRRVLAPQGGVVGAIGDLLYQPALEGVTLSLSPAAGGARVAIHSALDSSLTRLSPPATPAFTPTLQNVMPTGSILMLDVNGLDRVAPAVLNAGSAAGVAGGIGPLLSRLGGALSSEGVDVHAVTSIFAGESAVAIIPHAKSPTLVIVARTKNMTAVRTKLAQLEIPLAQLFRSPSGGAAAAPRFADRQVAGITDHQLAVANGLELDYSVFRGLVVISTSLEGVTAVAQRARALSQDPAFRFALGSPKNVTSLVYLDLRQLLTLGERTGLTSSATYKELRPDLEKIVSIGLTSTRSPGQSSAELSIRVP